MAERIERFKGFTKEMHGTKWGVGEEECKKESIEYPGGRFYV